MTLRQFVHLQWILINKTFDSVIHSKLSAKLKPLSSILTSIIITSVTGRSLTREPPQGSVSGPYPFNVFFNDLEIFYNNAPALFKNADDSTIVSPVGNQCDPSANLVEQSWSKENNMSCNQRKYKELNFRRRGNSSEYNPVFDIPQCSSLVLLGVTIQSDCKFRAKANKRLHVLRTLRKE